MCETFICHFNIYEFNWISCKLIYDIIYQVLILGSSRLWDVKCIEEKIIIERGNVNLFSWHGSVGSIGMFSLFRQVCCLYYGIVLSSVEVGNHRWNFRGFISRMWHFLIYINIRIMKGFHNIVCSYSQKCRCGF